MKKAIIISLIFAFVAIFSANALQRRQWRELGGVWECHEEGLPSSYDPGWCCPDGKKPHCWRTICINTDDNSVTEAVGCSCL